MNIDWSQGAQRTRVASFGLSAALGYNGSPNAVEAVHVNRPTPLRHVREPAVHHVGAHHQTLGKLPLNAKIHVHGGRIGHFVRKDRGGRALADLDLLHGAIAVRELLREARPERRKNRSASRLLARPCCRLNLPAPARITVLLSEDGTQAMPAAGEKFVQVVRVGPKPSTPRIGARSIGFRSPLLRIPS